MIRPLRFSLQAVLYGILLACALSQTARAQLSVDSVFERFVANSITGATIITHGFSATDNGGGYMLPLAQAIRDRLVAQTGDEVWLLDYDLTADGGTGVFNTSSSVLPAAGATGQSGHAVLLFDWAPESNETSRWWAEAAGDALFTLGTGVGIFDPAQRTSAPVQFIGHSFGTVVTTEAVERLAGYGVPVDQVTLIDPHDFDQPDVPTYDDAQRLFELGAPNGYGATIWNNVAEADVYYQTRGEQGFAVSLITADPEGRPLPGAYNRHLDDELPAGNPYGNGLDSDHGYTWNTFYTSTVTGERPTGAKAPAEGALDYSQSGWAHSIHNSARVPTPAANFNADDQDHEWSNKNLVVADDIRWAPEFRPGEIVNGDFESGNRTSAFVDIVAGWSHHGGGGDSEINSETIAGRENHFLRLDNNDTSRTHNLLYIPAAAEQLLFDFRIPNASPDDFLELLIGDTLLNVFDLTTTTGWIEQVVSLPLAFRNVVETFSLQLKFGSNIFDAPEVDFDNFRFALTELPGDYNEDGVVDAADYTVWRDQLGSSELLPNDDQLGGPIGAAHYELWKTNFGATSGAPTGSIQTVPEPATWILLLAVCGYGVLRRRTCIHARLATAVG